MDEENKENHEKTGTEQKVTASFLSSSTVPPHLLNFLPCEFGVLMHVKACRICTRAIPLVELVMLQLDFRIQISFRTWRRIKEEDGVEMHFQVTFHLLEFKLLLCPTHVLVFLFLEWWTLTYLCLTSCKAILRISPYIWVFANIRFISWVDRNSQNLFSWVHRNS